MDLSGITNDNDKDSPTFDEMITIGVPLFGSNIFLADLWNTTGADYSEYFEWEDKK